MCRNQYNTMNSIYVVLFYKFTKIKNPDVFAGKHLRYCNKENLLGKVLVANEGINGSISGSKQQVYRYMEYLNAQEQLSDVRFKIETSTFHPFKKMIVRTKNEIIRMDKEVDMDNTAKYISPKELLDLYSGDEEFIILDTRNNYESDVGKFKNAITPDINTFRDFPDILKNMDGDKNKKIITYCTGGIRCEKATAYMAEQGFTDVYQLKDGIINFCQEYPDTVWEGKCFVFDQRLLSDVDPGSECISNCIHCAQSSDRHTNCKNPVCDKLIILCEKCNDELNGCCSPDCRSEYKSHLTQISRNNQGHKSTDKKRKMG